MVIYIYSFMHCEWMAFDDFFPIQEKTTENMATRKQESWTHLQVCLSQPV